MAPTLPPTIPPTEELNHGGLSTAAIVIISVSGYMVIMTLALIIRQCLSARGINICPDWVKDSCGSCCGTNEGEPACCCVFLVSCAEMCDFNPPNKQSCMDSCCPSKEWCDEKFCCCMNSSPGGALCQDCEGPECGCGDACNCTCNCSMPESINCICFEIKCAGS